MPRVILISLIGVVCVCTASAAYIYDGTNSGITETFDGMPTSTVTGVFSATIGTQTVISGTQFLGTKVAGSGASATNLAASAGTATTGGIYSYGAAASTDRALGVLAAASNIMGFGFELKNLSASTNISTITISFTQENWRSSTVSVNTAASSWASTLTGATAATFLTSSSGFSAASALDLVGPVPVASNGALDGNSAANQVVRTFTFSGITVAPGESFFLRWQDVDETGSDAGLSLDNFNITINGGGAISNIFYWDANGSAAGVGGAGIWDATSLTFNPLADGTGATQSLPAGGKIYFTGNGSPTIVTIGAGATTDADIEFDVNGYTLSGGTLTLTGATPTIKVPRATDTATISASLSGSTGLRKTGAGKLVLGGVNSYSGGTTITQGVVEISNDNQLGDAAGAVTLGGGTLRTTADVALAATRTLSGTGSLDVSPSTQLVISGVVNVNTLTFTNTGTVTFTGSSPAVAGMIFTQPSEVGATADVLALNGNVTTSYTVGTATINGALQLGSSQRTFIVADGLAPVDLILSANLLSATVNGRLLKLGDGTLDLRGNNTALIGGVQLGSTGATPAAALNGGTLIIHDNNALGPGGTGTNGQFRFNAGTLSAAAPLTGASAISTSMSIGAGQIGVGADFAGNNMDFTAPVTLFKAAGANYTHRITVESGVNITFSGGLDLSTGTGVSNGLLVTGAGRLFITKPVNLIVEPVGVDGGHLFVSGGLATSVLVRNGGVFGGISQTGTQVDNIFFETNSVFSPGTPGIATGTLEAGVLDLEPGAVLQIEIGGTAPGTFDQVKVNGSITIGGDLLISLINGFTPTAGDTFTIIINSTLSNPVNGNFEGLSGGTTFTAAGTGFRIDYDGGDGNDVVLTVVPEPAGAFYVSCSLCLLASRRRRATVV